ncbi:MAG: glycosyltransferase family 2 protein [Lachnospiraceae bacterium]|nr:glycosyltransferase family 2 protein [Lachnospiraceae bacterium]
MNDNIKGYSVVILTHMPSDELIFSLEKLLSQTILPKKIVIYNTDLIRFFKHITDRFKLEKLLYDNKDVVKLFHIDEKDFDHGRTRNDAVKHIDTEYVLFLTDDAVPYDKSLCENLLNAFDKYTDKEKVATVYARQVAKQNAKLKEKYVREFNYPEFDVIKDKNSEKELGIKNYFCSNVCAMYDVSIFNSVGKFEEDLILNEDTLYAYKVINSGYKVVYSADAVVLHSHNYTYREQFSRNFDIGVSHADNAYIFKSVKSYSEGKKLVIYVVKRLLKRLHIFMTLDFLIECVYRFLGFKKGINYKSLTNEKCIKYAYNKKYFKGLSTNSIKVGSNLHI